MAEYEIDDDVYEIDKELERAVIHRYLEKKYFSVIALGCFLVGFLLGIIATH